jgi:soluble lytic murein transglycosylase
VTRWLQADPRQAYDLVQHAGFSTGNEYAEQQFLAGFIALRFLKDANLALTAFQRLDAAVARPISKSRAQYWQGRTYEALGDTAKALAHYRLAAPIRKPSTARSRWHASTPRRPSSRRYAGGSGRAAELDADALMPQMKILADLGQAASLRLFVDRDVETYPAPRHIKRLMLLLNDWGYPEIAVRLAKGLSYTGVMLPGSPIPDHPARLSRSRQRPRSRAGAGLIRQETEFDAIAVSSAGARGLMQMMPASAKIAAKQAKLPYRPEALLSDPVYNMQLGMTECRAISTAMTAPGCWRRPPTMPGPNNAQMAGRNGDPRATDPMDWIEQIPVRGDPQLCAACAGKYRGLPGAAGRQGCAAQNPRGLICTWSAAASVLAGKN